MSSCYENFAAYYDRLMHQDIPYEQWADYIENLFGRYDQNPTLICDLACGTGNITIPLAKRGYDMIGVDKSVEMLDVARTKAAGTSVLFLNQDLTKLDLYGTVDAFLCMIDGVNYILSPKALFEAFKRIKTCFLNPGGLLIFDISTRHKLANTLGNNTFIYDTDSIFYTWENRYIEKKRLCDMELNFFIKKNHGYTRFRERHLQRAYSENELRKILKMAGFDTAEAFHELTDAPPRPDSERIVFCAR